MVNQGETQVNRQQLETLDSQFNTRHSMFQNEYGEKTKLTEVGRIFFFLQINAELLAVCKACKAGSTTGLKKRSDSSGFSAEGMLTSVPWYPAVGCDDGERQLYDA